MTIIPFHGPRAMPVCRGRLQPVCFICAYRFQDHRRSGLAHSLSSRRLTLSSGILLSFGHFLGAVCTAPLLVRGRATSSTSRSFAFSFSFGSSQFASPLRLVHHFLFRHPHRFHSDTARVWASRARPSRGGYCHGSDRWAGGLRVSGSYDAGRVLLLSMYIV